MIILKKIFLPFVFLASLVSSQTLYPVRTHQFAMANQALYLQVTDDKQYLNFTFTIPNNQNLVIGFGRYMTGATMVSCDAKGSQSICLKYYSSGHMQPELSQHYNSFNHDYKINDDDTITFTVLKPF